MTKKRQYVSKRREQGADDTRRRVLAAAASLFTRHGIDRVTIAQIAQRAKVSVPTVYAIYKSKEGLLRGVMKETMFGPAFKSAQTRLAGTRDPVELVRLTASIARAIHESESAALGLMRGASAFSPALRKMEQEFETLRYEMQEPRVIQLYDEAKQRKGLALERARQIMWMYTSREVYRMLVLESNWSPDEYEAWLSETLVGALVTPTK